MPYFYRSPNGPEHGPISAEQLKAAALSGELAGFMEVRRADGEWVRASTVRGLFSADDAPAVVPIAPPPLPVSQFAVDPEIEPPTATGNPFPMLVLVWNAYLALIAADPLQVSQPEPLQPARSGAFEDLQERDGGRYFGLTADGVVIIADPAQRVLAWIDNEPLHQANTRPGGPMVQVQGRSDESDLVSVVRRAVMTTSVAIDERHKMLSQLTSSRAWEFRPLKPPIEVVGQLVNRGPDERQACGL